MGGISYIYFSPIWQITIHNVAKQTNNVVFMEWLKAECILLEMVEFINFPFYYFSFSALCLISLSIRIKCNTFCASISLLNWFILQSNNSEKRKEGPIINTTHSHTHRIPNTVNTAALHTRKLWDKWRGFSVPNDFVHVLAYCSCRCCTTKRWGSISWNVCFSIHVRQVSHTSHILSVCFCSVSLYSFCSTQSSSLAIQSFLQASIAFIFGKLCTCGDAERWWCLFPWKFQSKLESFCQWNESNFLSNTHRHTPLSSKPGCAIKNISKIKNKNRNFL